MPKETISYAEAGVNIDANDEMVEQIQSHVASTFGPRVIAAKNAFAGLFRLDYDEKLFKKNYRNPVLVACTDGVGTKLRVARLTDTHHTVGVDLVDDIRGRVVEEDFPTRRTALLLQIMAVSVVADAHAVLKPGGTFGVVQHHARDEMSDEFADGSHGYLKKAFVIAAAETAGFEFVGESDINANPNDQPTAEDIVWRLPPTLATSRDNPELQAELEAVGESNRMTLKFRKPE